MFIPLSSLLVWGPLGPGLMTFSTHCISCMRGMGIISLGALSLVSFHFFHPITLAYVTSRVWRPPWGHYFTSCLAAHTWAILELGRRLFLRAWWMGSWDDDLHWAYPYYRWWIFRGVDSTLGHTPLIDDVFFRDDALHWGIVSLLLHLGYDGLAVVGWPYTRGVALSDSVFIGDTVTLLDILHWDAFYSLMVDFWDDGSFWDTVASKIARIETRPSSWRWTLIFIGA